MDRGRVLTALALTAPIVSSCDAYLPVRGAIESSEQCLLTLRDSTEEVLDSRNVQGEFETGFIVAPGRADYLLSVECAGIRYAEITAHYPTPIDQPVEMGTIDVRSD